MSTGTVSKEFDPMSKDKPKITVTTNKNNDKDKDKAKAKPTTDGKKALDDQIKSLAVKTKEAMDDNADNQLALLAGLSMMSDFQKELFPVMVANVKQFIEQEEITIEGVDTKLKRHKLLPKEQIQSDKWDMNQDIPEPLPNDHTLATWRLMKKMMLHFPDFTEEMFWKTPIETCEFWVQVCTLKRQGFRRDERKS